MRWDDLQILRWIDEMEQSRIPAHSGQFLLERCAETAGVAWHEDMGTFVAELLLERDAGYLTWTQQTRPGSTSPVPTDDPNYWLQTICDIKLTLAGRDRARGRVVQVELPDAGEDDGRLITGLTLEEIARVIGDAYTPTQLPRYLRDSGLPADLVPAEVACDKWSYVLAVLSGLHDGGSAARRSLREFIGSWLDGQHHAPPPPDVRMSIVAQLGQQGWHVNDGRLVIGERVHAAPGTVTPLGRDARLGALHPAIRQVIERFTDGHLDVAIFEAFKAINNRVKKMAAADLDGSKPDLGGSKLMSKAFSGENPSIRFADMATQTGRDVQEGLHLIFKGAARAIRNPDAHEQFRQLDEEEALETLAFASMLMRRLDKATKDAGRDDQGHPGEGQQS
ncbi:MAG: TIGR02391 family protein [Acidimicrobiales bacterium]